MLSSVMLWIGVYVAGMFLVGYPIGLWSLKAWVGTAPKFSCWVLFPWLSFFDYFQNRRVRVAPFLMQVLGVTPLTLVVESDLHSKKRAGYIFVTMIVWPLRFCWSVVAGVSVSFFALMVLGHFLFRLGSHSKSRGNE